MLTSLKIENLALVEKLNWHLNPGLTAVTGETGAGKSVIIGALKLLGGERAEKSIIRHGAETALVQGCFQIEPHAPANQILESTGLPPCEEGMLIIRRHISQKSGRQFINDEPCTLATLKKLGNTLMDLHGPHDHQSLFSNERQLQLLDRYANHQPSLKKYHVAWRRYSTLKSDYNEFLESEMLSENELELYRYQLEEISAADLNPSEISILEEKYQRASNASTLTHSIASTLHILTEEEGLLDKLNDLSRTCRELATLDTTLSEPVSIAEASSIELGELEHTLRSYLEGLDTDPESYQELEDRINTIESLKRKYGGSVDAVLLHATRVEKKLAQTEERESLLTDFHTQLAEQEENLRTIAQALSTQRRKKAPLLSAEITAHLKDLGFKQSRFELELKDSAELTPHGLESVEFTFGPNLGERPLPLKQIASSGEMSRVMLALKSSLAEHDDTPLLVFDEIDANVGGEIAASVGQKMKKLSTQRQILSITHFPQVAAIAPSHCLVSKEAHEGRTRSSLAVLNGDHRIAEIVRMLGAGGAQATELAKSLLTAPAA